MNKYKRGDKRADGFLFVGYRFRDGKMRESWASPASYEKALKARKPPQSESIRRPMDWPSKFKMGDKRPKDYPQDGKVFYGYKRNGIACYEVWVTQERLLELKNPYRGAPRARDYVPTKARTLVPKRDFITELITNKQIREQAKALVANAMKRGLISLKTA